MSIRLYQVDAFTDQLFHGNPAAVCPLETWLPDSMLQAIASENNLSETAFFVPNGSDYDIRWFTPNTEVDLCGHATLASAHVLFEHLGYEATEVRFHSRSGPLIATRSPFGISLDFPTEALTPAAVPEALSQALRIAPKGFFSGSDWVAVYDSEAAIRQLEPDFSLLKTFNCRAICATAVGDTCDFVCRLFAPAVGIHEDPVTGSAYTYLAPYYAKVLDKQSFHARQLSARGGDIHLELQGGRVKISGHAVTFMQANLLGID